MVVLSVLPLFSAGPKNISSITFCPPFLPPPGTLKKIPSFFPFPPPLDRRLSSYPVETERYESHFPPERKKAGGEFIILPPFPDVAARAGLPLVVGGSVHEGAEAGK